MRLYSAVLSAAALTLALASAPQVKAAGDITGIWTLIGGHASDKTFRDNPESAWSHDKLPFTAAGRAAFDANHPGKGPRHYENPRERNDPLVLGNPPGLYRTLIYMTSMEFVQAPNRMLQIFALGRAWRPIFIDGRPVPKDVAAGPFWYGYSVGHWDGDTLVVDTLALDSRAWMDDWGTPITDDARIEERWRRIASDKLQLQITVTDPAFYSKPWTSQPLTYKLRDKTEELEEVIHAPIDEATFAEVITHPAGGK